MKKRILVIENDGLVIESYKIVFAQIEQEGNFEIDATFIRDSIQAENLLICDNSKIKYDLLLLDVFLGRTNGEYFINGIDIGHFVNKNYPEMNIFICSNICDNYTILNILREIKPKGFTIKANSCLDELKEGILKLFQGKRFYDQTILKLLNVNFFNEMKVDEIDRKMVHFLSLGYKLTDLPSIFKLSIGALEKRKRNLMLDFNFEAKENHKLIAKFKEMSLI